ncbi:MAG: PaaI family thioesterase [Henriciella sp.]
MNKNQVISLLNQLPFYCHFHMMVTHCSEGKVDVEMPFRDELSAGNGKFPAALIGAIGDVAAVASALSCLQDGWFTATLDFTIKTTNPAAGNTLIAKGQALKVGKTFSVSKSEIFAVSDKGETHCATLLASSRNYLIS